MPSNNAYDFLRQSIAGGARTSVGGASVPTPTVKTTPSGAPATDYSAIQPEQLRYRAPGEREREAELTLDDLPPIPPILTLPPGADLLDFVGRVERAYDIHYTDDKYVDPSLRGPEGNSEHALDLLDDAAVRMSFADYAAASDLFSLCVILAPNYFYHFCLASARYHMGDFDGTLTYSRLALEGIRSNEELSDGIHFYLDQMDFVDAFYFQFIESLIFTGNLDEAKSMTDFVVSGNVFQAAQSYLDLACDYSLIGELAYAAKLIDRLMPYIGELDEKRRAILLAWIPNILAGKPGEKLNVEGLDLTKLT